MTFRHLESGITSLLLAGDVIFTSPQEHVYDLFSMPLYSKRSWNVLLCLVSGYHIDGPLVTRSDVCSNSCTPSHCFPTTVTCTFYILG